MKIEVRRKSARRPSLPIAGQREQTLNWQLRREIRRIAAGRNHADDVTVLEGSGNG